MDFLLLHTFSNILNWNIKQNFFLFFSNNSSVRTYVRCNNWPLKENSEFLLVWSSSSPSLSNLHIRDFNDVYLGKKWPCFYDVPFPIIRLENLMLIHDQNRVWAEQDKESLDFIWISNLKVEVQHAQFYKWRLHISFL